MHFARLNKLRAGVCLMPPLYNISNQLKDEFNSVLIEVHQKGHYLSSIITIFKSVFGCSSTVTVKPFGPQRPVADESLDGNMAVYRSLLTALHYHAYYPHAIQPQAQVLLNRLSFRLCICAQWRKRQIYKVVQRFLQNVSTVPAEVRGVPSAPGVAEPS